MPTRGRLGTRVFLSECDRVWAAVTELAVRLFFYAPRPKCVGTTCVWAARSVQGPVSAMTSHIVIGFDDVLRCHWLFENLS